MPLTRRPIALGGLAMLVAACASPAALADEPTSAEIIALLNRERAANGLPADVTENPEWSRACSLHNAYTAAHGLTHIEDPAAPEYTQEGAAAGVASILSSGDSWNEGNPWRSAPFHHMQMMAPALAVTGTDARLGQNCMYTWPGYRRLFTVTRGWAVPGPGRTDVPVSETAAENPFVPGDIVGLPEGTTTGPHLYWYLTGPCNPLDCAGNGTTIADAELMGPDGRVPLRNVDGSSDPRVAALLPPGGISIPVAPLQPGAAYTARAVLRSPAGRTVEVTTSFRTAGPTADAQLSAARPAPATPTVQVDPGAPGEDPAGHGNGTGNATTSRNVNVPAARPPRLTLTRRGRFAVVRAEPGLTGRPATLRFTRRGNRTATRIRLRPAQAIAIPDRTSRVCISTGAVITAHANVRAARRCIRLPAA